MAEEVIFVHAAVAARQKLTPEQRLTQYTDIHRRTLMDDPCFVGDFEFEIARMLWTDQKAEAKLIQDNYRQGLRRNVKGGYANLAALENKKDREKGFQYVFPLTNDNCNCLRGVMENIWYNNRWWTILCRHNSSHWDKHAHCAGCYADASDVVTCCTGWPEDLLDEDDRCEVGKMMTSKQLSMRRATIRTHLNRLDKGVPVRPRDMLNTKVTNIATAREQEHKMMLAKEKLEMVQEDERISKRGVIRTETYNRLAQEEQVKFIERRERRKVLIAAVPISQVELWPHLPDEMRMAQVHAGEIHINDAEFQNFGQDMEVQEEDAITFVSVGTQSDLGLGTSFTELSLGTVVKQEPVTPLSSISTITSGAESEDEEPGKPWKSSRHMPHFLPCALLDNMERARRRNYVAFRPDTDPTKQQILGEIKIFKERYGDDVRTKLSREMQVRIDDALAEMGERMLNDLQARPVGAPAMPWDTVVDTAWQATRYDAQFGGFYTGSLQFPQVVVKNKRGLKIDSRFNVSHIDIGYLEQIAKYDCMACTRQEMFITELRSDIEGGKMSTKRLGRHLDRIGRMEAENRRMMACAVELVSYILFLRRREFLVHKKGLTREMAIAFLAQPIDPKGTLLRNFVVDG